MSTNLTQSVSWFTIVGALAALTHFIVAVGFEHSAFLTPSHANIAGFIAAFPVSYIGHRKFSFAKHTAKHSEALPRFSPPDKTETSASGGGQRSASIACSS